MRRIGLLTSDFALYHDLVRLLRERGIPFTSLAFGEVPDPSIGVVLTSWRDFLGTGLPSELPVVAVPVDREGKEDLEGAVAHARRILDGVREYVEVTVGIDPGQRPGLALIADGRLLHATQAVLVADVGPLVRGLLGQFPHQKVRVRIGHGSPRERDAILRDLWSLGEEGVRFEVVDESGTTPPTGATDWPPDVAAAIVIARTPGRVAARPAGAASERRGAREARRSRSSRR